MRSNLRPGVQANPPPASLQRDCAALNKTGAKAFGRSAAHLFMYAANSVLGLEAGTDSAMVAREASPTSRSGWSRRAWDVLHNDIALNLREGSLEKLVVIHEGSRRTIFGPFDSGPFGRTDL